MYLKPFLLTRPSRGATVFQSGHLIIIKISTHTPLAGRDTREADNLSELRISTHTPLAGRDPSDAPIRHDIR